MDWFINFFASKKNYIFQRCHKNDSEHERTLLDEFLTVYGASCFVLYATGEASVQLIAA